MKDFAIYKLNPDNDCSTWSNEKRELRGCGSSCGCPRMAKSFDRFDQLNNYLTLIRGGFLTLEDVVDADWDEMQYLMIVQEEERKAKEERERKIKEMFGRG